MNETNTIWFENSLCFKDKNFNLHGDWYDVEFKNIFISLDYCNPNNYNGTCKTKQEINLFLK